MDFRYCHLKSIEIFRSVAVYEEEGLRILISKLLRVCSNECFRVIHFGVTLFTAKHSTVIDEIGSN